MVVILAALAWGQSDVARADVEIPPEVRQALEKNAAAFSPIALTLEKKRREPEQPSDLYTRLLGAYPGLLKPCQYEFISQDGKCYVRRNVWTPAQVLDPKTNKPQKTLMERYQELSWDRKCFYEGSPTLTPMALNIVPIEKLLKDPVTKLKWCEDDDYLRMTGIEVPTTPEELAENPWSEVLRLLKGGRLTGARPEQAKEGGEHFVVDLLSGPQRHRFQLDPSLGYAVRRHEVWSALGSPVVVIVNSDFVKLTDPALWLPKHCHAEWYTWPLVFPDRFSREPAVFVDIQATRLERARVPPEQFVLDYNKPGSYIMDARLPGGEKTKQGRVSYQVPPNPADLDEAIKASQEGRTFVPSRRPHVAAWVVAGGSLVVIAVYAVLARRRWRRPTT
jgi:hypothetical protein